MNSTTQRLSTIENLGLSRKGKRDPILDQLTKLACDICESSLSIITILDDDYLWIESSFNFAATEIPRKDSICFYGLDIERTLEIDDLTKDVRFMANPSVVNEPKIRSYAGAPLISNSGVKIGFLCVLSLQPKKLSEQQIQNLEIIAEQAMFVIEARKCARENVSVEQQLEESRVYQKAVIDNVPSMIYIKNARKDMSYSLINPACQKMFGVTESEVIGKKDCDFLPVQLAQNIERNDQKAFASNQVIKIDQEEMVTPLGRRFFTTYKVPLFDENNDPKMLIVIMRDITESIRANEALEQERMKSLHNSKLATIGEISAGVAHEINNPLAVIAGSIAVLGQAKNDPEKFAIRSNTIVKSVERIAKIVNNLKKFSRYSETSIFNYASISKIVLEAIEMIETKANFLSIELRKGPQISGMIFCSELEIEQVLINLINNSMDAIRHLSVKWIEISTFDQNGEIILRVQDSGQGISTEVEKRLFEPFFTTKPPGEGTGLGLSISREILDRHQAAIHLNRKVEHTCFEIHFPYVATENNAS